MREGHRVQKRQTQQTRAEKGQDRRHDAVAAAAHGGGEDLHAAEDRVEKRQHADDRHALGDDGWIVGEAPHGQIPREKQRQAEQRGKAKMHAKTRADDLTDALRLARAVVLPGEGHDGDADGV